ncbi:MAG: hypothetical protein BWX81_02064 [Spirochaetes bacterium ADurb.Bin110]|nr:MAG: hypothetical protein BWX81_02064 [Spirochaetes bacterium ADurb.Bin110]
MLYAPLDPGSLTYDFLAVNVQIFASGSNVMIQLDAQVKPLDNVRLYTEGLMDDFQLGTEGTGSNPNAFGFHASLEWVIQHNSKDPYSKPRFSRKDHTTRIGTSGLEGALVA